MEAVIPPQSQERRSQKRHQRSYARERLLLPHMPIQLDGTASTSRKAIEQYISEQFKTTYQATVSSFLPYLLSTKFNNSLSAAVGFQPAFSCKPLFLENYLDDAIENVMSQLTEQTITRDKIVEIGNLTSSRRGSSQTLFILIAAILHKAGFEWVAFTATKHVQQILSKLNLETFVVCDADPLRLSDQGQSWGSYYNCQPKVIAGNLDAAIDLFNHNNVISFLLENYQSSINEMARQIGYK